MAAYAAEGANIDEPEWSDFELDSLQDYDALQEWVSLPEQLPDDLQELFQKLACTPLMQVPVEDLERIIHNFTSKKSGENDSERDAEIRGSRKDMTERYS